MASENFKQAFLDYGRAFIEEVIKQLVLNNKKATGELLDSLDYRIIESANEVVLDILANDYLKFVDKGRKAGTLPNVNRIVKWVEVKGISSKNDKRILSTQQLGWAIAKSIQKKGIKPTNVLQKAKATFFTNKANLQKVVDGATIDVKQLIKDAIKNLNDK